MRVVRDGQGSNPLLAQLGGVARVWARRMQAVLAYLAYLTPRDEEATEWLAGDGVWRSLEDGPPVFPGEILKTRHGKP
jgi:hypothetical protein